MAKPTFSDFVNAAFAVRPRLGPLGRLPLNYMGIATFVVLGLMNPGFWALGAALEMGFVYLLASNKRFQNWVIATRMEKEKEAQTAKLQDLVAALDNNRAVVFRALSRRCSDLVRDLSGQYYGSITDDMNNLLAIFAKMLLLEQRTERALNSASARTIEEDMAAIGEKLATEKDDAVARSLRSTLEIQKARLDNIRNSEKNLRLTRVEIDRIKNQIDLISEEIVMKRDPEQLSSLLNGVVRSIQDTSKFVSENADVSDAIETIETSTAATTAKN